MERCVLERTGRSAETVDTLARELGFENGTAVIEAAMELSKRACATPSGIGATCGRWWSRVSKATRRDVFAKFVPKPHWTKSWPKFEPASKNVCATFSTHDTNESWIKMSRPWIRGG